MNRPLSPPALKKGDTIAIMAPSSYVEKEKVEDAAAVIEKSGFRVHIHPQTGMRFHQSAGTHADKIAALHELFADTRVKAILAAGGGNRSMHLLDKIDYGLIAANPKILMGFSDVTALLNGVTAHTGLTTFHGPTATRIPGSETWEHTVALLCGHNPAYDFPDADIVRTGRAEGRLVGGNLSLFQYLAATPDALPPENAILFLEEVNEELSKLDRIFLHLRRTGYLARIAGLILGDFSNLPETGRPFGFILEDIIREHTDGYDYPIVMNAPFGHRGLLYTLPIGGTALLRTNEHASLSLTENPLGGS